MRSMNGTPRGWHTGPSSTKDRDMIMQELKDKGRVFKLIPGRSHKSYPKFICNPTRKLKRENVVKWLIKHAKDKGSKLLVD